MPLQAVLPLPVRLALAFAFGLGYESTMGRDASTPCAPRVVLRLCRDMGRRLHRYLFRVAPLPHATGGASAVIGTGLLTAGLDILSEGAAVAWACLLPATGWYGLALLCCADGYSRYREYQRLKRIFGRRGYSPRLLRPVASSRCQRDAALQAAHDLGHGECARRYFRSLGYRWYHLLPDRVVDNPLRFFDIDFLRTTFLPSRK